MKKGRYILALDQGTTSSRAFIFDGQGQIVASAYRELTQYFPKPGWVEHDADEIWHSCVVVIKKCVHAARINPAQISAIGITNQRETTVLWDRKTSRPLARAIVWQCRRTAGICQDRRFKRLEPVLKRKTGLVLDPYFSGTKIKWLLDNIKGLRQKAEKGNVCFGTIDSWLIWKLTGGEVHATDMTNASRTLIFNIRSLKWDNALLKACNIPRAILPVVKNSGAIFGRTQNNPAGLPSGIPIAAVLGDQQAALYGQGCYSPGTVKNTYGTGCFMVMNTGKRAVYSRRGLLTTLASDDCGKPVYALEGSVFIAGAVVQWLRDQLKVIKTSGESENAARKVPDTNGVYFVPAFTGLGAPYWDAKVRGMITGLTRGANISHIIRAGLESIAYQVKDVFDIMQKEAGFGIKELKVDGGACRNDFLLQFQSDMLRCRIVRPRIVESTAFGAALLAGVTVGLWKGKKKLQSLQKKERSFSPRMQTAQRQRLYQGWLKAVRQARCA
jgi:glycerol kinase